MPNKPSTNKYVPIKHHGLGFDTIPVKGERIDDEIPVMPEINGNRPSQDEYSDSSDELFDET